VCVQAGGAHHRLASCGCAVAVLWLCCVQPVRPDERSIATHTPVANRLLCPTPPTPLRGAAALTLVQGSIPATVGRVASSFGVTGGGMLRGLTMAVGRDGIYTAGLLGITPATQAYLQKEHGQSERQAGLYASVLGGVTCAFFSHPFDMIKTCLQVSS